MRYLQTVTEIASENNSTTIFPLPIDLIRPFMQSYDQMTRREAGGRADGPTGGRADGRTDGREELPDTGPRPKLNAQAADKALPSGEPRARDAAPELDLREPREED